MFIFSTLIFIGSLGWLFFEPGWEPGLFVLSSISGVIFSESHAKERIKNKYKTYKAKKISISEGIIITKDEELMKIFRPLCLGENFDIKFKNQEDDKLEAYAKNKVKDENQKYYLLAQVERRKKKLELCEEGFRKIAYLYRKGFIRCEIERLPKIARRYVSIVYPSAPNSKSHLERQKEIAFDVYSHFLAKREISFIADIPEKEVDEIIEKLEIKSTQDMCIPYKYSLLQIPDVIIYDYIFPAQILAGLTSHNEIINEDFWAPQSWAIGPH